jgi:hypothetical protein
MQNYETTKHKHLFYPQCFNYFAKQSLMAYLTNIFLFFQVEFFHTPAIIWGTFLQTKNSTSYISSSAKSKISVKHLCVILSWYLISEFVIQKYKDYDIQNYNITCCLVWM